MHCLHYSHQATDGLRRAFTGWPGRERWWCVKATTIRVLFVFPLSRLLQRLTNRSGKGALVESPRSPVRGGRDLRTNCQQAIFKVLRKRALPLHTLSTGERQPEA